MKRKRDQKSQGTEQMKIINKQKRQKGTYRQTNEKLRTKRQGNGGTETQGHR